MMKNNKDYWQKFREYHQDDVWGFFQEWLAQLNNKRKKNEKINK